MSHLNDICFPSQGYTYGDCIEERFSNVSCISYVSVKSFRTVDGECNNLNNPSWGATNIPLKRVIGKKISITINNYALFCQGISRIY